MFKQPWRQTNDVYLQLKIGGDCSVEALVKKRIFLFDYSWALVVKLVRREMT